MGLIAAGLFLLAFVANVSIGAKTGEAPIGDVAEMLLLLGASVSFVVAIIRSEAAKRRK